jgi:hypothetical protein
MGTLNYKTIDNFLDKEFFNNLKNILFSRHFPWFFREHMIDIHKDNYYFFHCFYDSYIPKSSLFDQYIISILNKIKPVSLLEVRANLLLKNEISYQSGFHVDRTFECKTAILYMNTCNGYTLLDEDKKIKITSEENKLLIFDSQIKHAAVSQTDTDRRIVINFNYF